MKTFESARELWDQVASRFDDEPDHGMRDPETLKAWKELLRQVVPSSPAKIADIGCGTGSLSILLAQAGHQVTGIDASPAMLGLASTKANSADVQIEFHCMDAACPNLEQGTFDVVLCRHVLWALPEPQCVLRRWHRLLKNTGRLVLIEGFWSTQAGMHAEQILRLLPPSMNARVLDLSPVERLWGKSVQDERFVVIAEHR